MIDEILTALKRAFPVEEVDLGSRAVQKVKPMKFALRQFKIGGVGNLFVMQGKALLGLMKMDTVILTPLFVDAPLYSYDRIFAMGRDTMLQEFYDIRLEKNGQENLDRIAGRRAMIAGMAEHDPGRHWYDSMLLPESVFRKGRSCKAQADAYELAVLGDFIDLLKAAPACDEALKRAKANTYVNGLFENGGPSTDAFVKAIGREEARRLFGQVIFGTDA